MNEIPTAISTVCDYDLMTVLTLNIICLRVGATTQEELEIIGHRVGADPIVLREWIDICSQADRTDVISRATTFRQCQNPKTNAIPSKVLAMYLWDSGHDVVNDERKWLYIGAIRAYTEYISCVTEEMIIAHAAYFVANYALARA